MKAALWHKRTCRVDGTIMVDLRTLKDFVVPIYVQFSRDKHIMDGAPEKLRRELEEELKQCGEEPHSHAWYHGAIPRQVNSHKGRGERGVYLDRKLLCSVTLCWTCRIN